MVRTPGRISPRRWFWAASLSASLSAAAIDGQQTFARQQRRHWGMTGIIIDPPTRSAAGPARPSALLSGRGPRPIAGKGFRDEQRRKSSNGHPTRAQSHLDDLGRRMRDKSARAGFARRFRDSAPHETRRFEESLMWYQQVGLWVLSSW